MACSLQKPAWRTDCFLWVRRLAVCAEWQAGRGFMPASTAQSIF
jgi:hypothetical protein